MAYVAGLGHSSEQRLGGPLPPPALVSAVGQQAVWTVGEGTRSGWDQRGHCRVGPACCHHNTLWVRPPGP